MLNNFLSIWLIFIFTLISINIIIRLYKYYINKYIFSFDVSTFIDLNGINLITYITFKYISYSPLLKWKSKENFINLFKAVIFLIKNDSIYLNKKLCIIISEFNTDTKLYNILADPIPLLSTKAAVLLFFINSNSAFKAFKVNLLFFIIFCLYLHTRVKLLCCLHKQNNFLFILLLWHFIYPDIQVWFPRQYTIYVVHVIYSFKYKYYIIV
jgi:hypothetical protein